MLLLDGYVEITTTTTTCVGCWCDFSICDFSMILAVT